MASKEGLVTTQSVISLVGCKRAFSIGLVDLFHPAKKPKSYRNNDGT